MGEANRHAAAPVAAVTRPVDAAAPAKQAWAARAKRAWDARSATRPPPPQLVDFWTASCVGPVRGAAAPVTRTPMLRDAVGPLRRTLCGGHDDEASRTTRAPRQACSPFEDSR